MKTKFIKEQLVYIHKYLFQIKLWRQKGAKIRLALKGVFNIVSHATTCFVIFNKI